MVSLKVPLEHFLQYLEKEERVHRALGGLTTALGSVIKAFYDLSMFARAQRLSVALLEPGSMGDIWKEMVLKPTQGFVYIHEHKDDPAFFTKLVHHLSNQLLSVIIFPKCYPGRCGGWELISREDVAQQLAKEDLGNILECARHETALTCGPLRKWAPENLSKALRIYSELPLEPSEFFWTLHTKAHTKAQTLIVSHISSVCGCHCWT